MGLTWEVIAGTGSRGGSAYGVRGPGFVLVDAGCSVADLTERPEALILSHAHRDHTRGLVEILERFPGTPVIATSMTRSVLRQILKGELTETRANAISDNVIARKFHEKFEVGGVSFLLREAGHIEGAAMILARQGDQQICITSDFSRHNVPGLAVAADFVGIVGGTLVMECSLGTIRELDDWTVDQTMSAIPDHGLVICGALGEARALASLATFTIHDNLSGYVDGETVNTTKALESLHRGARVLVGGKELTTGSASWELAAGLVGDAGAMISFVNRPPRGTTGHELFQTPMRSRLRGFAQVRKRCTVRSISLPLHAPFPGLIATARECSPEQLALVHNHEQALHGIARRFKRDGIPAFVPTLNTVYDAAKAG